jgi:phosphoribosylformylglycinamidine synthase I
MSVRIAIIQFPGSNCERETRLAVLRAGMEPHDFLWNEPSHLLATFEGFIIVGGFSYEDRGRAGIIAAFDPLLQYLKLENAKGKPILGICNGAQILVEAGFVPGLAENALGLALTDNKQIQNNKIVGTGYYNAWVHMKLGAHYQRNAFTKYLTTQSILRVPIAHGEGRFVIPPALLMEMQANGQTLFQYCDVEGRVDSEFPINPNGSVFNLAAISNKAGNVLAMMPHPERTPIGDPIFLAMRDTILENKITEVKPMHYTVREVLPAPYILPKGHHELFIELNITDNAELTVNQVLKRVGVQTKLKRFIHWEINCDSELILQQLKSTELLYNPRKETLVPKPQGPLLLVRAKEDQKGQETLQILKQHFAINGVKIISQSIAWELGEESQTLNADILHILKSNLLCNPFAYDCFYY